MVLGIAVIHVVAAMIAGEVFHLSIHRHMPDEAEGPDMPLWMRPTDTVLVPLRMWIAVQGSVVGGRITLSQRPFADMTATYLLVAGGLAASWFVWRRTRKRNTQPATAPYSEPAARSPQG
jgi:hypothetical protein